MFMINPDLVSFVHSIKRIEHLSHALGLPQHY